MNMLLTLAIVLLISCQKEEIPDIDPQKKTAGKYTDLVWAEEFNYSGKPDPAFWTHEHGFIRNFEVQYYTDREKNCRVENGRLIIQALYNPGEEHPITSASIVTRNKVDFQYGRIEVRAKMPTGSGAWPAIWTIGTNEPDVSWPFCGEIDILEYFGWIPGRVFGSLYAPKKNGNVSPRIGSYIVPFGMNVSNEFHTYAIEWDSTRISWFFDDRNYRTYYRRAMSEFEWAPFMKPHYLLLNLALGTSGGKVGFRYFPFIYEVDYVRYYK